MKKIGKSRCAVAVGAVALALGTAQVSASELTVVNFGERGCGTDVVGKFWM